MAFSTHDQVPDSPTNTFATLNPLEIIGGSVTPFNGNLAINSGPNAWTCVFSTIGMTTQTYYWECVVVNGSYGVGTGIVTEEMVNGDVTGTGAVGLSGNSICDESSGYTISQASSYTIGDIVSFLYDGDNGALKYSVNNGTLHTAVTGKSGRTWFPFLKIYGGNDYGVINFGQDPTFGGNKTSGSADAPDAKGYGSFYYDPPTGALALCTANLPSAPDLPIDPAVDDLPEDYFKSVIWTGDGTGTSRTITVGFGADLIWSKKRSGGGAGAAWHQIYDTVRGYNSSLNSNTTNSETTSFDNSDNHGYIDQFTSTGFRFTDGSDGTYPRHYYNENGETYVAWCWKAGGAPTADNSNTSGAMTANSVSVDGTLQSNYTPAGSPTIYPKRMSVNTKTGFSIVKYTGNSTGVDASDDLIPHGLNSPPEFFVLKDTSRAGSWNVGISNITGVTNQYIRLNEALTTYTNMTVQADSNVIRLNHYNAEDTVEYICYAWHSVAGYSAFGSYIGNGSADGPFVYTGFRPAWIMVKWISGGGLTTGNWRIMDTARNPYNPATLDLIANEAVTETTYSNDDLDILSNGFKWRSTGSFHNTNGAQYIYAAFAEQPFKYATAR